MRRQNQIDGAIGLPLPEGAVFAATYGFPANILAADAYHRLCAMPKQDDKDGKDGKDGDGKPGNGKGKAGKFGAGQCGGCKRRAEDGEPPSSSRRRRSEFEARDQPR